MTGADAGQSVERTNDVAPHPAPGDRTRAVAPTATIPHPRDTAIPMPKNDRAHTATTLAEEATIPAHRDNRDNLSHPSRDTRRAHDTDATNRGGKLVAWAGFVFGSVLSIVMNWLHTWLPAATEPPGWSPGVWPQIGSAVWPVTLLLAVEALSRVRWRTGVAWSLARYGGVGTVAAGSALISYGHVHDVLDSWDYGVLGSAVGPLVLDGLMVACGFALLSEANPPTDTPTPIPANPAVVVDNPPTPTPNTVPGRKAASADAATAQTFTAEAETETPRSSVSETESAVRHQVATLRQPDTPNATAAADDATARDSHSPASRDHRILALHAQGRSSREIADEIGVHHSTVARIVARNTSSDTARDITTGLRLINRPDNGQETAS